MNKIYYPEDLTGNLSAVLEDAIQEDYNRELEWLWVADIVPNAREREYCLRRALYINPTSRKARHGLNEIAKNHLRNQKHKHTSRVTFSFPKAISHFIFQSRLYRYFLA